MCATASPCVRRLMIARRPWVASTSSSPMPGVAAYGTVRQADEASFERVLDINLNGVFRTLKYATPHLERSRGHAMVVASAISFTPLAGLASYAASKAGVEMLALAYRQEVAHLGITVGLVHPSWIDTDLVRGAEADLPSFQELRGRLPYPGKRHHECRPRRCDRARPRASTSSSRTRALPPTERCGRPTRRRSSESWTST